MDICFRLTSQNRYSFAAIAPLIPGIKIARGPTCGINLYSFSTANASLAYKEASNAPEESVLIAGGPHPSGNPEETLKYFDYVVIGEGEETLPDLLRCIQEGLDPAGVRGIAFKQDEDIVITSPRDYVDLDRYPCFDPNVIFGPIEITRGCPWGCTYCQTPRLFGRKMRHRSIDSIKKYAAYYDDLRFTSPNAFAYGSTGTRPATDKIRALLRELSSMPGKRIFLGTFPSEVRPEFVNPETVSLITEYCSNQSISIGAQSGSSRILESIKRGHTIEDVEKAIETCVGAGLTPIVDFIFGIPGETPEDQHMSLDLVRWIIRRGGRIRAHHFTPLPSTPLQNEKPSPISRRVQLSLGRLSQSGKAEGAWTKRK